jgi:hypothetical protein
MDATFGTNDVKYNLFALMVFDFHHTGVPYAWVITSWQTCENLVEQLNALWAKLFLHMPNWKPSCFIVDDASYKFEHCGRLYIDFKFFVALSYVLVLH